MEHYAVQFTTPKFGHELTETVEASSFGGAEKAIQKAWEWAKPIKIKAIWVEENDDSSDKEAHIVLPEKLRSTLACYLVMSAKYRERERDAWRRLSAEKAEDGTTKYKNAESNASFWENVIQELKDVQEIIDKS